MLKIDGIYNVRDMGGWSALGGKTMKYGKIIRGSRLNRNSDTTLMITPAGINELLRLGVRAELDMRDESSAPMKDNTKPRHSYLGEEYPIANFTGAYQSRIATFANAPHSIQGIKQMIAWFKQDKPVYLHCSVGADRTGTVAYLVGALCGMSEDALCRDFELTSFSCDTVENEADLGTWEILVRQRTAVGRLDKCSSPESYNFKAMVEKIKSFPGATLQRKVYNHLREGVSGVNISAEDLAFLVKYLTDYSLLAGMDLDVDTLWLNPGETHKIIVTPYPADADYTSVSFKSTSKNIATVASDGTVTAVAGGEAYIIVDVDGIEKLLPVIVPITDESIPSYTLYNKAMGSYLSEVTYSADDYSTSEVSKYDTISVGYSRRDWPSYFMIKWMPYDGVKNQHLYVSDNPLFYNSIIDVELPKADSTYRIENLTPQSVYYYKISGDKSDGSTMMLSSSAFKVSGTARVAKAEEVYNIRDFGGWTGMDGYKVKYGILFRGSRLRENLGNGDNGGKAFTDDTRNLKADYKLNAEIDLRTASEVSSSQSVFGNKVQAKYLKVPTAQDCLGENILSGDAYITAMSSIIAWTKLNKKIYIASSLGADRAGAMAFLVNGLLGVDENDLAKDYELSSFTEDPLAAGKEFKRNTGNYPAMVEKIKTLEGSTLQIKIYNYFKNGINGTSIAEDDLKWFICFMLDYPEDEFAKTELNVKAPRKPSAKPKYYNAAGIETGSATPGLNITDDGAKFLFLK
jgi:protein tyrosine/serine phosphatase